MENYKAIFDNLWAHSEHEVVEFKEAKQSFDFEDLGKYISALSNEANLRDEPYAWIIFGVSEKTHTVVGTHWKDTEDSINKLKHELAKYTTDGLTMRDLSEIEVDGKRVLVGKIPASARNIVTKWKGIAYGRDGDSLVPLDQAKQDEIRLKTPIPDWSAELVPNATLDDLDDMALAKARVMYKRVHASKIPPEEVDGWSDEDFLANSSVYRDGKLTRAALLLLGKPSAVQKLAPAVAQITWTLRDEDEMVVDYEHFTIPFILTVDNVLGKIRNLTMRELPGGTLFPDTMKQYDDYTIREALHNCIAHQDYRLQQRINFVENPGNLYYANGGSFIPGSIEEALKAKGPQRHFRNECLCQGMVNFNMIDTVGRGIKKMYTEQRKRYFPMPDYEIDKDHQEVAVTIYGKMIDENYSAVLKSNSKLTLEECILLDSVQKGQKITKDAARYLKSKDLLEGRSPEYRISAGVARLTHQLPSYTRRKGLEKERVKQLVLQLLNDAGDVGVCKKDVYAVLKDVLPSGKTPEQQQRFVGNLLVSMKGEGSIHNEGRKWYSLSSTKNN